jgi:hypothetical protein
LEKDFNLTQSHFKIFFQTKFPFQAPPDQGWELATTRWLYKKKKKIIREFFRLCSLNISRLIRRECFLDLEAKIIRREFLEKKT